MADPAKARRASRTKNTKKKTTKKKTATSKPPTRKLTKKAASGKAKQKKSEKRSGRSSRGDGRNAASLERPVPRPEVSGPEWQRMIAEAAYFKALNRGFVGGSPERDWAEAEAEVRARLTRPR